MTVFVIWAYDGTLNSIAKTEEKAQEIVELLVAKHEKPYSYCEFLVQE